MCDPHFYSMKITEDVRKFVAQQKISKKKHSKLVSSRKLANSSRKAANYISRKIHSEKVGNEIAARVVT